MLKAALERRENTKTTLKAVEKFGHPRSSGWKILKPQKRGENVNNRVQEAKKYNTTQVDHKRIE